MDSATIAAGALLLNAGLAVGAAVWAVGKIRTDIAEKAGQIRSETDEKFADLSARFDDQQRTQDHNFGEVGAAMRQYIADVEKQVRELEIWGRDNFVQKGDLKPLLDQLRSDFKEAVGEIKEDIRQLMNSRN